MGPLFRPMTPIGATMNPGVTPFSAPRLLDENRKQTDVLEKIKDAIEANSVLPVLVR